MANDLNSLLNKIKEDKQRIRIAIETKLNTHIPSDTKLDVFDDYIYKINSTQEYSKNLLTIPKDMELFRYNGGTEENPEPSIESVYFDVNLVEPEETPSSGPDLPEGKKYSTAKYITVERPDDLLPKYIANGKTIFGITGSGFDPDNPTTATCDYVAATPDGSEENITFIDPNGVVSQGTLVNNCGKNNLNTTLTEPRFSSSGYISSIGVKPTGRYIVNNNSELDVQLAGDPGVVGKINRSSYDDKYKILPENIKVGCNIFGVAGTFSAAENNPITENDVAQGKVGFVNGEEVTGVVPIRDGYHLRIGYGNNDSYIYAKYGLYPGISGTYWEGEVGHKINNATLTLSIQDNFSEDYNSGNESGRFVSGYRTYNAMANLENTDGPIKAGTRTVTSEYTISPSMLINQVPFNNPDEYDATSAADSGNVLQGALFVDREGRVRKGTMPIISETTWDRAVFTDNKLQITPFSSSVFSPNAGYYNDSSKVYINQDIIKDAYNRSVLGTNQIKASNIRAGCNILGVTGTYGGDYIIRSRWISSNEIDFNNATSITIKPANPRIQAWNEVSIGKDSNLISDNIRSGITIYGITGTFTSEPSTGQSLASSDTILKGYSAWVDGEEVEGNIPVNTIDDGNIYTKEKSFNLNGYYSAGTTIRIAKEEQNKLIPGNIRIGETILGVTGTYKGGVLLETIKDSSLNETTTINASSPVKLDANGTSFIYNPDGKNAKNRICWYTKNYNIPLAIADSDKYFVPEGAEVSFNVIPNIITNKALPILVDIYSVRDDFDDPSNPREVKINITLDYLISKGKNYNLLVLDPSGEEYSIRTIDQGVPHGYTLVGALVNPIQEYDITTTWNYGAFEYIEKFENAGRAEFKYDEVPANINNSTNLYKRYILEIKTKDGVYVDVSDTTAISYDVLKDKYFHTSDGVLTQGSLVDLFKVYVKLTGVANTTPNTYKIEPTITYNRSEYKPVTETSFIYHKTDPDIPLEINISKYEVDATIGNWEIKKESGEILFQGTFNDDYPLESITREITLDKSYLIEDYVAQYGIYTIVLKDSSYIGTTATPERVLSSYKFYDINGTLQTGTFSLTTKTIEANGENITPSSPYGGFSSVTVNVPQRNLVTYKILDDIPSDINIDGHTESGVYVASRGGLFINYTGSSLAHEWHVNINGEDLPTEQGPSYFYYPTGNFTITAMDSNSINIEELIHQDSESNIVTILDLELESL